MFNHHTNKRAADNDVIDLISGSNGLAGAVDNTIVITRPQRKKVGVLHRVGRDYIDDNEINLKLEDGGYFTVVDPEMAINKEWKEIVDVMKQGYQQAKEIAEILDKKPNTVSKLLYKMVVKGVVIKNGYGKYKLVDTTGRVERFTQRVAKKGTKKGAQKVKEENVGEAEST